MDCSKSTINTFKGILIIFIVIGHNTFVSSLSLSFWCFLYNFHVLCFLFLPFLYPVSKLSLASIKNNFVRYYFPLLWVSLFSFILFNVIIIRKPFSFSSLGDYFLSLIIGSASLFDKSTGFQLFWFLPALFSLLFIKNLFFLQRGLNKTLMIIIFIILHLIIGNLSTFWKIYTPVGLHIVFYIFILCLSVYWINQRINESCTKNAVLISLILFGALSIISLTYKTNINIGVMQVYSLNSNLFALLLHDLIALSAFFFFFYLSTFLEKVKILEILGKNSLVIFLTHSLVFYGILLFIKKLNIALNNLLLAIITLITTLSVSLIIALLIHRTELLRKLVTPRNWEEFKSVFIHR